MATRREARGGTLVLGGGLAGAYVARLLGRHGATVVNRENVTLYTPLLPEAASGTLEPRHVVVPLRQMCPHAELLVGEATRLDEAARSVEIETHAGTQVVRWQRLSAAPGRAAALGGGGGRPDDPVRDPAPARLLGAAGARPPGCRATPGRVDPPTCQHALRQARRLVRSLAGEEGTYRNRMLGRVATLGRYQGLADVLGVRVRGFPGWFLVRTYHLGRLPLATRKLRLVADWTTALAFRRDIAELSMLGRPARLDE